MASAFTPLTEEPARGLAGWRYEPPYDFNTFKSDGLRELLDRDSTYLSLRADRSARRAGRLLLLWPDSADARRACR